MLDLGDAGHPDLVVHAGAIGIEGGRDDRYPNAVHDIHARMGAVLLEQGAVDQLPRGAVPNALKNGVGTVVGGRRARYPIPEQSFLQAVAGIHQKQDPRMRGGRPGRLALRFLRRIHWRV